jgi:hypothetical protein
MGESEVVMRTSRVAGLAALASTALLLASCGGSDNNTPAPAAVSDYLSTLPKWEQFSPTVNTEPEKVSTVGPLPERVDFPVKDAQGNVIGIRSEQYSCTTTEYSMKSTPEKIVMFSPDREILWPGALIQGKSHRDGLGSLLPLAIHERTPIKVSIPSLANGDNFRVVALPDQAEVNQAIGNMIGNATSANLVAPSSIQFTMSDYTSAEAFAVKAGMSGKYLGFSGNASGSVDTKANENTVMVYFVEKMFEVVVEPPQTPVALFNADFTREKLDEQIALGRLGPNNLPVYVSNIVYGRMMAFTFTSSATSTQIKAALTASYKGIFDANFSVDTQFEETFRNAKITVTSLGGSSSATVAMIASGNWHDYFKGGEKLTAAYPLSYTLRNLGDGSIATAAETTAYKLRECAAMNNTAGFMLDSFETAANWPHDNVVTPGDPNATRPLTVALGTEASAQSIFYGYEKVSHMNYVDPSNRFVYDVGYIVSPHFTGKMTDFYRGEMTFWYRPDEFMYTDGTPVRRCYTTIIWILFIPIPVETCYWLPSPLRGSEQLTIGEHTVLAHDDSTTADQIVLRGGSQTNDYERLTLTYNPVDPTLPLEWQRHAISLSNDDAAGHSLCVAKDVKDPATGAVKKTEYYGCWVIEDRPATEYEIQYVLSYVSQLKLRASNAVHAMRDVCTQDDVANCTTYTPKEVLLGYVGGYFDEIKITKPQPTF